MKKTVLLIVGPTAVGKTSVAIQLARHFNTEIISADSRQCFKELTIGVAKPSLDELQQIPHHFINSHFVHDTVTAASFEEYALAVAEQLFQKHNEVVMVGGTGLYIKAFCEGMDFIPAANEGIRNQLQEQYQQMGIEWLQKEVQLYDPLFAEQGEMQNPQRMLRALEVIQSTKQSILSFRKGEKQQRNFNILKIGLELPREELYQQINHRVDVMMKQGLLEEVKSIVHLRNFNALQTVGYKELFEHFDGTCNLQQAVDKIKQNTRHYAKRQLTWFKKDEEITWFQPKAMEEILQFIKTQKKPE